MADLVTLECTEVAATFMHEQLCILPNILCAIIEEEVVCTRAIKYIYYNWLYIWSVHKYTRCCLLCIVIGLSRVVLCLCHFLVVEIGVALVHHFIKMLLKRGLC